MFLLELIRTALGSELICSRFPAYITVLVMLTKLATLEKLKSMNHQVLLVININSILHAKSK